MTLDWRRIESREGDLRLGAPGRRARGVARAGHRADPRALGNARVGERRPRRERAAALGGRLRRVRAGGGDALLVGPPVDRLERAEPAALARARLARALRDAAAQPRRRRDQERHPVRDDRRRRDRSARWQGRYLAGRLHPRHGPRGSAPRRLRAPPAPALAGRVAVQGRLRPLHDDLDGEPRAPADRDPPGVRSADAHLADGARLPDEPARQDPRRPLGNPGAATSRRRNAARTLRRASTC